MSRSITIATALSGICCVTCAVLWPATRHLSLGDPSEGSSNSWRLTTTTRCGLSSGGIWIFSDVCPYTGGLRFLSGDGDVIGTFGGPAYETIDYRWGVRRFGVARKSYHQIHTGELIGRDCGADFPGIYYRHFDWKYMDFPWRTLRVSLWYPILLFSILPARWVFRRSRPQHTTNIRNPQ